MAVSGSVGCAAAPGGRPPFPWTLRSQTATFFKPEQAGRSAFRVEPLGGS